jgi:hypothetical protein
MEEQGCDGTTNQQAGEIISRYYGELHIYRTVAVKSLLFQRTWNFIFNYYNTAANLHGFGLLFLVPSMQFTVLV